MFRVSKILPTSFCVVSLILGSVMLGAQEMDQTEMSGRALYNAYQCWQCHGYEGQGGADVRIVPTLYPFEVFDRMVRHPNLMPAYSLNVLSDEKLRRIYDFLRSLPEPPPLEDIPALQDS